MFDVASVIINHIPGPTSSNGVNIIERDVSVNKCSCRESIQWTWDSSNVSDFVEVSDDDMEVLFNRRFSNGTAVVRSTKPMTKNQYYWELKMTQPVYGTDVMVGVGTAEAATEHLLSRFVSRIGMDDQTWGLSHRGLFHHNSEQVFYSQKFEKGNIIGVHLDLWNGTLSFFKDRKPLGIASSGLRGKTLYAMASSTAACTGMRIVRSCSFPSGLQYLCAAKLRELVPDNKNVLDELFIPPGLKRYLHSNLNWLLDNYLPDDFEFCKYCVVIDKGGIQWEKTADQECEVDEDSVHKPYGIGDQFVLIGSTFHSDLPNRRDITDVDLDSEDSNGSMERDNKRQRTSYWHACCSSDTDCD